MAFWDDIKKQSGQVLPTPSIPPKTSPELPQASSTIFPSLEPLITTTTQKQGFWDTIKVKTTTPTLPSVIPAVPESLQISRPPKTDIFPEPKPAQIDPNLLVSTYKSKSEYYDRAVSDLEKRLKKHEDESSYWIKNQDKLDKATFNVLKAEEEALGREIDSINNIRNSLNLNVAEIKKYQSKLNDENLKSIQSRKEVISAVPQSTSQRVSETIKKYTPPIFQRIAGDVAEGIQKFRGGEQVVDFAGNLKETTGFFETVLPGLAKTDFKKIEDRYNSLLNNGIDPKRADLIVKTYIKNKLDPNTVMPFEADRKTIKELALNDIEKKAINDVKFFENLNSSLDLLNFTGSTGIVGSSVVKAIAKETYPSAIKKILQKEIRNIPEEIAEQAAKVLAKQTDEEMIKKFLQELDFGVNKYEPKMVPEKPESISGKIKEKPPVYEGEKDLTTTILKDLEGRETVSPQYIQDATNRPNLKQTERDIIRNILKDYSGVAQIPVKEFAEKVKTELLPLDRRQVGSNESGEYGAGVSRYENITLPDNMRGEISKYSEHVYNSPIKTSAGDIHFSSERGEGADKYFGHTRVEDMADDSTRRVIEVQSDLYQKDGAGNFDPVEVSKVDMTQESRPYIKETMYSDGRGNFLTKRQYDQLRSYNNPTAHFRMVREEVKKAAQDGKNTLLFPTGQTAMKIEGLAQDARWEIGQRKAKIEDLIVGERISDGRQLWVITEVIGDGKFKAVPKDQLDLEMANVDYSGKPRPEGRISMEEAFKRLTRLNETFDISGKVDTNNPIYKFYEKEIGRYLKNKYEATPFTDSKGVTWWKIDVKPNYAQEPVLAFKKKGNIIKTNEKQQSTRENKGEKRIESKKLGNDSGKVFEPGTTSPLRLWKETFKEIGVPENSVKEFGLMEKRLPETLRNKAGSIILSEGTGTEIMAIDIHPDRWDLRLYRNGLDDISITSGSGIAHEIGGHLIYSEGSNEFREIVNKELAEFISNNLEEARKIFMVSERGIGFETLHTSYYEFIADALTENVANVLIKNGVKEETVGRLISSFGFFDKEGNIIDLGIVKNIDNLDSFKKKIGDFVKENKNTPEYLKNLAESNANYLLNEWYARLMEYAKVNGIESLPTSLKETLSYKQAESLVQGTDDMFKNLSENSEEVRSYIKRVEPPIPGETPESKLAKAREILKATEKKQGVKPVEVEILTTNKEDRLLIEKALREMDRISKKESFLESLKIKLPKEFETKIAELIIRKQALDENPLKNVIRYMAKSGEFKGSLPEVTGEGKGIFRRRGDDILTEVTGIDDTEKARDQFDRYVKQRKQWEKDMAEYQAEKQDFLKKARGKRETIIEDKKVERLTQKTEKHISEILDTEEKKKAAIERARKAEEESREKLAKIEEMKARYEKQVRQAHLSESQKKTLLSKFKAILSPIEQTDSVTKQIYIDWETSKLKAKEDANKTYEIYKAKTDNDMPSIIEYEAGKKTPWIKEAFDDMFDEAKKKGLDLYYKEDYIPHVYKEKPEQIKKAVVRYMEDNRVQKEVIEEFKRTGEIPETIAIRLKIRPNFQKIRTFPDYQTAMKYNLTPRFNTVAEHLAYYKEEMGKTIANQKLIDDLIANGKLLDEYDAPESWIQVKLPGRMRRSYYGERNLADSLNGQFRDEQNLSFVESIHRRLAATAQLAQDIVLTGGIPGTTINNFAIGQAIRMLTTGVGEAVRFNLKGASTSVKAASAFLRANFQRASINFFKENQKYIDLMAENNVPIFRKSSDYTENYRTWKNLLGKTSRKEAYRSVGTMFREMKEAKGIREFSKAFMSIFDSRAIGVPVDVFQKALSDKTFVNMMPQMQIQVFKDIYEKAIKAGMPAEDAAAFASNTVRNEFGAINDLGRTQGVKDVFSSYFFAPRFRESMINIFVNGAKAWTTQLKNPTYSRSRSLILGMIISYIAYNYLNQRLNDGDNMWENEPGREFALKIPLPNGKIVYTDFMPSSLAFLRNMGSGTLAFLRGDSETATQKFGTLFSIPVKIATEIVGNKDYFGRPIYELSDDTETKIKKSAEHLGLSISHPYIRELVKYFENKQSIYQTLSMMAELPLKFSNEEKAAMSRHYETQREKTLLNAQERNDIRDMIETYDNVQKLKIEGNASAIDSIIDGLSDDDYQQYRVIMKYEQIQALKKAKKTVQAKKLGDELSDEEYKQYQAIKSIRTSQKRKETVEKKVNEKVAPKYEEGTKVEERTVLESIKVYANAVGVDPVTAFKRIFSGQRIRRVDQDTIIVDRLPLLESARTKKERGATSDMRLDHTLPLQLGGDNSDSNLKLVPYEEWKSYTPVENHLGKLLRSDKITKKEAQNLIVKFKNKQIKAEDILKL